MRLLHISDPHFGTERPAVVAALLMLAQRLRPDVLLLSGDITQRATTAQFKAARQFVQQLALPQCVVIPGNHDIPLWNLALRCLRPYSRYKAAFGDELQPSLETDELLLLGLNTTRWWRHIDGQLSDSQIERTAQRLAAARPGQRRVVMVHQPLAVTLRSDEKNRLHGHALALQRWGAAGVDLVLGGHIHLPFVQPLQHGGWAVQAGTALSSRVRPEAENSVNLIHIDPASDARAEVERWDFEAAQGAFTRRTRHRLVRDSAG